MKKAIKRTFVLFLLCVAVILTSCGKDDSKTSSTTGTEAPEGIRELTKNGITAKIDRERWAGYKNTVLYVNLILTKSQANSSPKGKVYVQAKATDGEILQAWSEGVFGQGAPFGSRWIGNDHHIEVSIPLNNGKQIKPNSLTISKLEVF